MNIEDIEIIYSEDQEQELTQIIPIIKSNYFLFADWKNQSWDFRDKTSKDFDLVFERRLKMLLENPEVQEVLEMPETLPSIYSQFLIKELQKQSDTAIQLNGNIPENMLWFILACKYYNVKTQFSELTDFMKYQTSKKELLDWLKETQRFETYNYLLQVASDLLKEYDLSFYNHIDDVIAKSTSKVLDIVTSEKQLYQLENMSISEVEATFLGFLDQIKAPNEWKKAYYDLKSKNAIIYEEQIDKRNNSASFLDKDDGRRKIRVTNNNTVETFINLVHEFIHHHVAITSADKEIPFSLLEFPSIYYEKLAAIYLVSIGYDKNIIEAVMDSRNQNNVKLYESLIGIMLDISRYNNKGPITIEEKIEFIKKLDTEEKKATRALIDIFKEAGIDSTELENLVAQQINYEEEVKNDCDAMILGFAHEGLLILNGYQYLTDSWLAEKLIENSDSETPEKMIYITNHLADFTIDSTLKYLDIQDALKKPHQNMKKITKEKNK